MPLTPTNPGDLFNAASVNGRLAEIVADLNAVNPTAIRERALGPGLHPGAIHDWQFASFDHAGSLYQNQFPGHASSAMAAGIAALGWRVVDTAGGVGGGTPLQLTFATPIDILNDDVAGIAVTASVELVRTKRISAATFSRVTAHIALQAKTAIGAWTTIPSTHMFLCPGRHGIAVGATRYVFRQQYNIPLRFTFRADNPQAVTNIAQLRLVTAFSHATANNPEADLGGVALGAIAYAGGGF
jgi:hypothetical protein